MASLVNLMHEIVRCERCPRLVRWREQVSENPPRRYRGESYWGKPIPGFGDPRARLLIVGLAPAAHGGNRTGRVFTGDRSGDYLFRSLHRFGFCTQPSSLQRDDGLRLRDAYITAALHCAPPGNKPARAELANCRLYLRQELQILNKVRVVVVLGRVAWHAYLLARRELEWPVPKPRPKFAHGVSHRLDDQTTVITSYHPSQQNTQTGRLTEEMFDEVFARARELLT